MVDVNQQEMFREHDRPARRRYGKREKKNEPNVICLTAPTVGMSDRSIRAGWESILSSDEVRRAPTFCKSIVRETGEPRANLADMIAPIMVGEFGHKPKKSIICAKLISRVGDGCEQRGVVTFYQAFEGFAYDWEWRSNGPINLKFFIKKVDDQFKNTIFFRKLFHGDVQVGESTPYGIRTLQLWR